MDQQRCHVVTSASANNQLRHMRILSVYCCEDDMFSTLGASRVSNLNIQPCTLLRVLNTAEKELEIGINEVSKIARLRAQDILSSYQSKL